LRERDIERALGREWQDDVPECPTRHEGREHWPAADAEQTRQRSKGHVLSFP